MDRREHVAWLAVGACTLLAAWWAGGEYGAVANLLIPAAAWMILRGLF